MASPDNTLVERIRFRKKLMSKRPRRRKPPKMIPPTGIATSYARYLQAHVSSLSELVLRRVEKDLASLISIAPLPRSDARSNTAVSLVLRVIDDVAVAHRQRVTDRVLTEQATTISARVQRHNKEELDKQFNALLGIPYPESTDILGDQLDLFVSQNVQLIRGLEDETLSEVQAILMRHARQGSRYEDIRDELVKSLGVSESRAALIARDQVLKLNGEITQLRHREAGIEEYEWVTSQDEKVRPSHESLNGKIFRWDKPPVVSKNGRTGHPGEDIQCRCTANPVIPASLLQ